MLPAVMRAVMVLCTFVPRARVGPRPIWGTQFLRLHNLEVYWILARLHVGTYPSPPARRAVSAKLHAGFIQLYVDQGLSLQAHFSMLV